MLSMKSGMIRPRAAAAAILLVGAISLFLVCRKEALLVSAYPLSRESVETALEGMELDWAIAEEVDRYVDTASAYVLEDESGGHVGVILSSVLEDGRFLSMHFVGPLPGTQRMKASLALEDWEKALTLGALLFGKFRGEDRLCREIMKVYKTESTILWQAEETGGISQEERCLARLRWDGTADGVSCMAIIEQWASGDYLEFLLLSDSKRYPASGYPRWGQTTEQNQA